MLNIGFLRGKARNRSEEDEKKECHQEKKAYPYRYPGRGRLRPPRTPVIPGLPARGPGARGGRQIVAPGKDFGLPGPRAGRLGVLGGPGGPGGPEAISGGLGVYFSLMRMCEKWCKDGGH